MKTTSINVQNLIWKISEGNGPIVATAIHHGHNVGKSLEEKMVVSEADRLREEDPFTGDLTDVGDTQIISMNSRFKVDLNRPRDRAVYVFPEDAWGIQVWKTEPSPEFLTPSFAEYDAFYAEVKETLYRLKQKYGYFVVLDFHSYNHRRGGPNAPFDNPELNPEVNIGTGTMNRERWSPIVDRFITDLSHQQVSGRPLDIRENVKFKGGQFSRWVHETFPESGCALAVEFKKFFMDEWSGKLNEQTWKQVHLALESAVVGLREELQKFGAKW